MNKIKSQMKRVTLHEIVKIVKPFAWGWCTYLKIFKMLNVEEGPMWDQKQANELRTLVTMWLVDVCARFGKSAQEGEIWIQICNKFWEGDKKEEQ